MVTNASHCLRTCTAFSHTHAAAAMHREIRRDDVRSDARAGAGTHRACQLPAAFAHLRFLALAPVLSTLSKMSSLLAPSPSYTSATRSRHYTGRTEAIVMPDKALGTHPLPLAKQQSWPGDYPDDPPAPSTTKRARPESTTLLGEDSTMFDGTWSTSSPVPTWRRFSRMGITRSDSEHRTSGDFSPRGSIRRSDIFEPVDEPGFVVGKPILFPLEDAESVPNNLIFSTDSDVSRTEEPAPTSRITKNLRGSNEGSKCGFNTTTKSYRSSPVAGMPWTTTAWWSSVTNDTAHPLPEDSLFGPMHTNAAEAEGSEWCTLDSYEVQQPTNSHASERLQNAIAALVGEQEYNDDDDEEISPVEIGVAATMITSCIAPNSDFSASLDMDIAAGYDSAMYQGDYENY